MSKDEQDPKPRTPLRPRWIGQPVPNWDQVTGGFLFMQEVRRALDPLVRKGLEWRMVLDESYFCPSSDSLKTILERDRTDRGRYKVQRRDCDNFAALLYARCSWFYGVNSVGIVIGAVHAFNLAVLADGRLRVIEPQTDQCWTPSEATADYYSMEYARLVM